MTHAYYVPKNCVPHILNTDEIGQRPYENFVAEIINREVIHWAPIKRQNNGMFPSGNKQQSVRILDQSVDLKKTKRSLWSIDDTSEIKRDTDQKYAKVNFKFNSEAIICPQWIHPFM